MKKLYFTRHGQTVWNVENKICGVTDIELTELGKQQAVQLGKTIAEKNLHIDQILCSPLIRAKNTAQYIADITGLPLREEERLREQCFGKYEGTARNGTEFLHDKGKFIHSYDGGETMLKLAQRIYNLIDDLKKDDKVYLLVAHNGISRVIQSYFYDMENDEYASFGIGNCEILEYDIK